jgi:hypothetical protein
MRSKAISKAILDFIVTSTFLGCCWTWVLTLQLDSGRLRINLWLLLNPLSYIVLAVAALYFYRRTIRMKHENKTNTKRNFAVTITCIGIVTLASIFWAYRTARWMVDVELPDTIVGTNNMILITVGVINGILIGLVLLTIGYYWLPQNGRKRKE